ncbi:hypothetical protein [Serratia marcescens]|uniref:hypothetical protein n=1 Tax=Serratia marcescens TaxID=615 RepID=UPI0011B78F50|nr:hypothetical protein [Serratia marcescens]
MNVHIVLQRKQDDATVSGRFIPAIKIRLLRAENLRDFSAAAGGRRYLPVVLVFFSFVVFYSIYGLADIFIFC